MRSALVSGQVTAFLASLQISDKILHKVKIYYRSLMNVFIVGAAGALGRQIARRALDEGHEVTCLVRNTRKASFLNEWGAKLVPGNLCNPDSLKSALKGSSVVIDAATARANDALSIRQVDWDGKVALIQAVEAADVDRFIFFSIMGAGKFPHVPLMDIKYCTELFLKESKLNYTILRTCGFYQGLIGQYAIPVLDNQAVWVMDEAAPIAYMDTQDIAKFAINAITQSATENRAFDLAGLKAWSPTEILKLCERLSGREAKVRNTPIKLLRNAQKVTRFFQWSWNIADRLAFTEVMASGQTLDAPMDEVYAAFDVDPDSIVKLEDYLKDYFDRILKKLKAIEVEKNKKESLKRTPFKAPRSS